MREEAQFLADEEDGRLPPKNTPLGRNTSGVNESRFSFLFCAKTEKQYWKKIFSQIMCEETLGQFLVPPD